MRIHSLHLPSLSIDFDSVTLFFSFLGCFAVARKKWRVFNSDVEHTSIATPIPVENGNSNPSSIPPTRPHHNKTTELQFHAVLGMELQFCGMAWNGVEIELDLAWRCAPLSRTIMDLHAFPRCLGESGMDLIHPAPSSVQA